MESLFSSARLVYRAIEDTPEDEAFMHTIRGYKRIPYSTKLKLTYPWWLESDVVAFANSDSCLLKPMTKKESAKHKAYVVRITWLLIFRS